MILQNLPFALVYWGCLFSCNMNFLLIISSTIVYGFLVPCSGDSTKKFIIFANQEEASEFYPRVRDSGKLKPSNFI